MADVQQTNGANMVIMLVKLFAIAILDILNQPTVVLVSSQITVLIAMADVPTNVK